MLAPELKIGSRAEFTGNPSMPIIFLNFGSPLRFGWNHQLSCQFNNRIRVSSLFAVGSVVKIAFGSLIAFD
jgi:hypothetical protein